MFFPLAYYYLYYCPTLDQQLFGEKEFVDKALDSLENFVPLYKFYQKKVYNYCYYRLPTEQDAEDVTSQVFINALNAFANKQFQNTDEFSFKAWLFRIAHNLVVDFYRDKNRYKTIEVDDNIVDDESVCKDIEDHLDEASSVERIILILKRFDDCTQTIFVLKLREDMSFEEISQVIGLDISTVKMKYYRALKLIKRIVSDEANY